MRFRLAEAPLGGNSTIDFYSLLLFHPYKTGIAEEVTNDTISLSLFRGITRESRLYFYIIIYTDQLFCRIIISALTIVVKELIGVIRLHKRHVS